MADMSNLIGDLSISSLKGGIMDMAVWIIWGLVILGVVVFVWMKYQDKKIYKYPVRIFRQRRNGMVKEMNTFGGYIKKGKITQFIIKMGKLKKKPAESLPLSEFMDEDDRVYFWQLSPESPLIQTKRTFGIEPIWVQNEGFIEPSIEKINFDIETLFRKLQNDINYKDSSDEELKEIAKREVLQKIDEEKNKMIEISAPIYTPVQTDLKQQAMIDIAGYKQVLGIDVNKQFAYFVMGVIALIILGIVIFYIAVNKGDVPIITQLLPILFLKKHKKLNKVFID